MAGRLSCCLNLPLPNPNSSQSSRPSLWKKTEEETKPRKTTKSSCLVAFAACVVIGAADLSHVATAETAAVEFPAKTGKETTKRWSDKRKCPAWLQNSLETIVPENLPRPSSRRRWESVGTRVGHAPPVSAVVSRAEKAGCFSM